ncbi:MAG TPA: DUF2934 domain-containing protein [Candidatus Acidoferrum sp.]|nr:DUF2934 domain-containing protein [Candidatus Acidoferrum sp.]
MPKAKSAATPKPKAPRTKKSAPTHEEISRRAYEIYLERSGAPGDPHSDWLRAEAELGAAPKKTSRKSKVVSIAA